MIKCIIFDWGGVLIDNPKEELLEYCASYLKTDKETLEKEFREYSAKFQKGEISEDEVWSGVCIKLNIKKPDESLWKRAVEEVFRNREEVFNLVKSLKEKGYKVGFLSNTEVPAMEYFLEKKYDHYFDAVLFSCTEGRAKPEKEIYLTITEKLQVEPHEIVFIDDKEEFIEGAEKAGLNGIVFKTIEQIKERLRKLSVD